MRNAPRWKSPRGRPLRYIRVKAMTLEETEAHEIENPDGSLTIRYPGARQTRRRLGKHGANLAERLSDSVLMDIASELLDGISEDEMSRSKWMSDRTRGLDLLALKLETPRADAGSSTAPVEGMSTVRSSMYLEASLRFQANAQGELLPPEGPIKIAETVDENPEVDERATRLTKLLNAYVTRTCPEYYPDHDRMFFKVGSEGAGIVKGFHCPLRRRPVLDCINVDDIIVNNTATDFETALRVTHRIRMHPNVLRRMQRAKAYRTVDLAGPVQESDQLSDKRRMLQGLSPSISRQQDIEHTIYECYTEYDIPGFEVEDGLYVPYKIVIDKSSRTVLEIRRDWREGDRWYRRRKTFVIYPYVPIDGFYPFGLLHILGNTTNALTAGIRLLLDSGMFSNFPGSLHAQTGDRQANLNLRVPPGGSVGVNLAGADDIRKVIMPLPYKPPEPVTMQLLQWLEANAQRLGSMAELQVGESRPDAPVGTTLALLEQAGKLLNSVHRRCHTAQAQEFEILKELLAEDPDALWRDEGQEPPDAQQILIDLNDFNLAPVADPDVPSQMHRLAKAQAVKQLAMTDPPRYNMTAVDRYCLTCMRVGDPQRFFAPPQPPQANPALMAKVKSDEDTLAVKRETNQLNAVKLQITSDEKEKDRQHQMELEKMRLAERIATHPASSPIVTGGNGGLTT